MESTAGSWWRTDATMWSSQGWQLELRGDELADIRHGGRVLLRAVRAAVRDHGWQTVPAVVESVDERGDALTLELLHAGLGAEIRSTLAVHVSGDDLLIEWDAVNSAAFDTCRTGLVVLHPADQAGAALEVEHADGTSESMALPTAISPHQPVFDIRELRIAGGPQVRFEGDIFEMEDQRNWSDASFKTYSRPLGLPYPYLLDAGERVRQTVLVRAPRMEREEASERPGAVIDLHEAGPFPTVGVEASTAPDPIPTSSTGSFRVVELNLTTPNWRAALARAAADGRPLDVRLITDGRPELLEQAVQALRGQDLLRVAAFDTVLHISDADTVSALRAALSHAEIDPPVLGGTRSHFTELNREQSQIPRNVDGIALTTTPLFHTLDVEQLIEALPIQRLIAEQAVAIAGAVPVHIGPVSLRARFNNVATTPEPAPIESDLSAGYGSQFTGASDQRQGAAELASWLAASAAALAVPGVASLSWFETAGPRGVAGTPAAGALDALVRLAGGALLMGASPDGMLWAVGSRSDATDTILAANVGREARTLQVRTSAGSAEIALGAGSWGRCVISR